MFYGIFCIYIAVVVSDRMKEVVVKVADTATMRRINVVGNSLADEAEYKRLWIGCARKTESATIESSKELHVRHMT